MSHFYQFPQANTAAFREEVTPSTQILIDEAIRAGYSIEIPEGTRLVMIKKNGKTAIVQAQTPETTSYIGYYGSEDKGVCRALLQRSGLQIPNGYTIRLGQTKQSWTNIFHQLRHPLVVKPTHGSQGNKVYMNIVSETDYCEAVEQCFTHPMGEGPGVVVEEQFVGTEYRIIATREETLAVMCRMPANVKGDGTHTISELIAIKNQDPRRVEKETGVLVKIKIDEIVLASLSSQQLTLDTVIAKDQLVLLRPNSNISTGGDSIDMTDTAHESVKKLAVQAVRAIPGLAYAGVDFMTKDISIEQTNESYKIIELNKSPGFSIHEQPYLGEPRRIAQALLKMLFL